jgi:hypothetical protein
MNFLLKTLRNLIKFLKKNCFKLCLLKHQGKNESANYYTHLQRMIFLTNKHIMIAIEMQVDKIAPNMAFKIG